MGGLTLNISSNGLLAHVGNAMMGAGMCTTYQGVEKTIKKKKYTGTIFCVDIAFGAVTNVLTGGITVAGDILILSIGQCGAKEIAMFGTKNLAIRIAAGAVGGITTKITNEVKECLIKEKKWSYFGKTLDQNGKEKGTVTSWIINTVVGGLYGISIILVPVLLNQSRQILLKCKMCRYRWNSALSDNPIVKTANIAVEN